MNNDSKCETIVIRVQKSEDEANRNLDSASDLLLLRTNVFSRCKLNKRIENHGNINVRRY
jgi:hypothetical protein